VRLRFTDGIELETSGYYRVEHRRDGYYVLGGGLSIPVGSHAEGLEEVARLSARDPANARPRTPAPEEGER
jgi:hypothetical protein